MGWDMRIGLSWALLTALTLGGCTVNPKATIVEVTSGDQVMAQRDAVAAFYMQGSRLEMAFKKISAEGKPEKGALTVASVPIEATARRFLLVQNSDLFSRTTLVVAKRANTDLIASLGSEVQDNRLALIQNVAAVAKVAVGLVVAASPPPLAEFTTEFELANPVEFTAAAAVDASWRAWKHSKDDNLTILVGPTPVTAKPYSADLLRPKLVGIFSAACRPVVVDYSASNGQTFQWRGKIADPDFVEFTVMPRKGKIEYHDQCGTSVTTEKDPTQSNDAIFAAMAAQAAALKEAYDKANKD